MTECEQGLTSVVSVQILRCSNSKTKQSEQVLGYQQSKSIHFCIFGTYCVNILYNVLKSGMYSKMCDEHVFVVEKSIDEVRVVVQWVR